MKKGLVLNFKKLRVLNYVTLNKFFIVLSLLFVFGITVGSIAFSKNDWLVNISQQIFNDYTKVHSGSSFFIKFFNCLFRYIIILVLYFLSGTSMLGIIISPMLVFWQGVLYGGFSAHLYTNYAINGIAFNATVVVPPVIISVICCFFAARESMMFAIILAKLTLPRSKPTNIYLDFKKYCGKFLIFILTCIFATAVDIILNLLLSKFFNF